MTHSWTQDKRAFENYIISKAKHVVSTQKNCLIEHPNIVKTDWLENNHNYILKYCFPIWTYERALDTDQGNIQVIPPPPPPPPPKKNTHTHTQNNKINNNNIILNWSFPLSTKYFFQGEEKENYLAERRIVCWKELICSVLRATCTLYEHFSSPKP